MKTTKQLEDQCTNTNALAVVERLNEMIYAIDDSNELVFEFVSIGYMFGIEFAGHMLWHSESDWDRHYQRDAVDADGNHIEVEHEDTLFNHIRRVFNKHVERLNTLKFKRLPKLVENVYTNEVTFEEFHDLSAEDSVDEKEQPTLAKRIADIKSFLVELPQIHYTVEHAAITTQILNKLETELSRRTALLKIHEICCKKMDSGSYDSSFMTIADLANVI